MPPAITPPGVRMWKHIMPEPNSGCWLWTGLLNRDGYGIIGSGGKNGHGLNAHRVSYETHNGPIPEGMLVCHKRKCNNRACVNPEHLYLGTQFDNMRDASALGTLKGRRQGRKLSGEEHRSAKLTWEIVRGIREEKRSRRTLNRDFAARYGVSLPIISRIVNGKIWRESHA